MTNTWERWQVRVLASWLGPDGSRLNPEPFGWRALAARCLHWTIYGLCLSVSVASLGVMIGENHVAAQNRQGQDHQDALSSLDHDAIVRTQVIAGDLQSQIGDLKLVVSEQRNDLKELKRAVDELRADVTGMRWIGISLGPIFGILVFLRDYLGKKSDPPVIKP